MSKTKKESNPSKKNPYEIELDIQTKFGKLKGVVNYSDAHDRFWSDFQNYIEEPNGVESFLFAVGHAHGILKELIPQILEDALKQVWFEAKARTLHELNNKPSFLKYDAIETSHISTIEVFAIPKPEIKKICDEVADKAIKDSQHRMQTKQLLKRGGNKQKKLDNYDFINLDYFYEFYYLQAKSILVFYEWQKELRGKQMKQNDADWNKHFLECMFQTPQKGSDLLFEKLDISELTEEEKAKYKNIRNSYFGILSLNNYEIELWKNTFRRIFAVDFNPQEAITFEFLSPEKLTYHYLATIFEDKYNTKFNFGTIENNLKDIRRIKRGMLKE